LSFRILLDKFKGMRAVVIGDLMLDEYVFGQATRISPEAPVMVVRQNQTRNHPGGAANVALNLIALGAKVSMVGVVGCDASGQALEEALDERGIEISGLINEKGRTTTRKTRIVADHAHQVLRIDHEDEQPVSESTEAQMIDYVTRQLDDCQVLVMSDYLKGAVTPALSECVIERANKKGIAVVANPKPRSLSQYRGARLLSLNRVEASEALGLWRTLSDEDAPHAAESLQCSLGVDGVLITLGEAGMVFHGPTAVRLPAPRVEVYDTAGAGDTVVATAALGVAALGLEPEVFRLAAQTAASVVRRVGVATPSKEDLEAISAL